MNRNSSCSMHQKYNLLEYVSLNSFKHKKNMRQFVVHPRGKIMYPCASLAYFYGNWSHLCMSFLCVREYTLFRAHTYEQQRDTKLCYLLLEMSKNRIAKYESRSTPVGQLTGDQAYRRTNPQTAVFFISPSVICVSQSLIKQASRGSERDWVCDRQS